MIKELLKNRKVQLGITGVALVAAIGGGYAIYESNKVSIDYTLNNHVVEYGEDQTKIDWLKQSTTNGNKVTVAKFDTKKIGETDVVFTVCLDDTCKEFSQKLEIKDTKSPVIELKKEKVEITEGDKFDPVSNIASVKDVIDGEIKKSDDKKLTKNGYLIDSNVDSKKAGSYKVKIIAYDVNGNKTEKEYAVTVKEKTVKTKQNQTHQQQKPQTNYTPPTTSQNQGSTKPLASNKPSNNQTQTCVANGQWRSTGNSGYAGYNYDEVFQWGEEHCPENHGYAVGTVHDICGKEGWSVEFFELH
ncbi:MAG: DUF5011 domain-containing protein [Erysipelotrichaceae bacterium]|nr:DUF5011 domain-containing protein [Erysipelotrichaceae bacterium]